MISIKINIKKKKKHVTELHVNWPSPTRTREIENSTRLHTIANILTAMRLKKKKKLHFIDPTYADL